MIYDNNEFVELTNLSSVNQKMRYVKFSVSANNKVSGIKVYGYPVKYDNLSADATIVDQSGSMANAIDKSNYTTIWNAGVNGTLVLDLDSVAEIYQTAIMFSATSNL